MILQSVEILNGEIVIHTSFTFETIVTLQFSFIEGFLLVLLNLLKLIVVWNIVDRVS